MTIMATPQNELHAKPNLFNGISNDNINQRLGTIH